MYFLLSGKGEFFCFPWKIIFEKFAFSCSLLRGNWVIYYHKSSNFYSISHFRMGCFIAISNYAFRVVCRNLYSKLCLFIQNRTFGKIVYVSTTQNFRGYCRMQSGGHNSLAVDVLFAAIFKHSPKRYVIMFVFLFYYRIVV